MNEFVAAAAEAAAASESAPVDGVTLISRFLEGGTASSGVYHTTGNALYEESAVVARICPNGVVLTGESSLDDTSMNDAFVGTIFSKGRALRRTKTFKNLSSPKDRLAELDAGNIDQFAAVAGLFNFEYTPFELDSLQRAKEFRERVEAHFTKIEGEEKARIKKAADAARAARLKGQLIAWDSGEGSATNYNINGAGGGQRLRLAKHAPGTTEGRKRVNTSHGRNLTLASAKRAFEFASQYWHGGKEFDYRQQARLYSRGGGHETTVSAESLNYGCQSVTRREAERFADVMGWDRAEPEA